MPFPLCPFVVTARGSCESDIGSASIPFRQQFRCISKALRCVFLGRRDLHPTLHHFFSLTLSPHRHVFCRSTPVSSSCTSVLHVDRPPFSPTRLAPESERASRPRPTRCSSRRPRRVVAHAGGQEAAVPRVQEATDRRRRFLGRVSLSVSSSMTSCRSLETADQY